MDEPKARNFEEKFTAEQIKHINKHWNDNPPMCCIGKCLIHGVLFASCYACSWSEDYMPPVEPEYH